MFCPSNPAPPVSLPPTKNWTRSNEWPPSAIVLTVATLTSELPPMPPNRKPLGAALIRSANSAAVPGEIVL